MRVARLRGRSHSGAAKARDLRRSDEYKRWRICPDCRTAGSERLHRRQFRIGGIRHPIGRRSLRWSAGFGDASREQLSNPGASCRIAHTSSRAALQTRVQAKGKELFDNLALRTYCLSGARPTPSGILHREVEWSRNGFVLYRRVTASLEK
jgi:hypothetical protein